MFFYCFRKIELLLTLFPHKKMKIRDIADTILFVFIVCAIMVIGVILSPLPPETKHTSLTMLQWTFTIRQLC